jgi:hypothetical protein
VLAKKPAATAAASVIFPKPKRIVSSHAASPTLRGQNASRLRQAGCWCNC